MKEVNKKLRLLVTAECHNNCPLCCNKQFDVLKISVVEDFSQYEEIIITGGEPMLFRHNVYLLLQELQVRTKKNCKFYLYTAKDKWLYSMLLEFLDGVTYTPHTTSDIIDFIHTNENLLKYPRLNSKHISLRLNLFKEVKNKLPKDIDLSLWTIK